MNNRTCPKLLATLLGFLALPAHSEIVRLEISETRSPTFDGHEFGKSGAYEWLIGQAWGELDPKDPRNEGIVNLSLAPANENGRVEYRVDVAILKPVDKKLGNRRIFYDVLNRGNKYSLGHRVDGGPNLNMPESKADIGTGFLMESGYTMVWSSWQSDLEAGNGRMLAEFPIARAKDGSAITALHRQEMIFNHLDNPVVVKLHYPVADPDPQQATLTVRQHERDARLSPPGLGWSYAGEREIRIERPAGYDAGAIYEFIYPARDPVVTGIGFAAVRDVVAFLRHAEKDAAGKPNPLAGQIDKAIAMGLSQSGRFLRDFVYQGFNEDLQGRVVFEGVMPMIAGSRLTQVNRAFSTPGAYSRQHEDHTAPDHHFPFTYPTLDDPISGRRDGILARCETSRTCPKVFHIDTDSELWQAAASLVVTDTLGRHIELPENVRAYLLSAHQHHPSAEPEPGICQQPNNALDFDPLIRALLVAMDQWITDGTPPPASRFPNVADGTLVPATHPRAAFPSIPGFRYLGLTNEVRLLDHDDHPPTEGPAYPVFVGAKDTDGNNIAGIRHPYAAVPTATYTGWSLRRAGYAENALCSNNGACLPFAKSAEERARSGDQRLSLEERYANPADYFEKLSAYTELLVDSRLLLPDDASRILARPEIE